MNDKEALEELRAALFAGSTSQTPPPSSLVELLHHVTGIVESQYALRALIRDKIWPALGSPPEVTGTPEAVEMATLRLASLTSEVTRLQGLVEGMGRGNGELRRLQEIGERLAAEIWRKARIQGGVVELVPRLLDGLTQIGLYLGVPEGEGLEAILEAARREEKDPDSSSAIRALSAAVLDPSQEWGGQLYTDDHATLPQAVDLAVTTLGGVKERLQRIEREALPIRQALAATGIVPETSTADLLRLAAGVLRAQALLHASVCDQLFPALGSSAEISTARAVVVAAAQRLREVAALEQAEEEVSALSPEEAREEARRLVGAALPTGDAVEALLSISAAAERLGIVPIAPEEAGTPEVHAWALQVCQLLASTEESLRGAFPRIANLRGALAEVVDRDLDGQTDAELIEAATSEVQRLREGWRWAAEDARQTAQALHRLRAAPVALTAEELKARAVALQESEKLRGWLVGDIAASVRAPGGDWRDIGGDWLFAAVTAAIAARADELERRALEGVSRG